MRAIKANATLTYWSNKQRKHFNLKVKVNEFSCYVYFMIKLWIDVNNTLLWMQVAYFFSLSPVNYEFKYATNIVKVDKTNNNNNKWKKKTHISTMETISSGSATACSFNFSASLAL